MSLTPKVVPFMNSIPAAKPVGDPSVAISVILPCFNEEENLVSLFRELMRVLERLSREFEILFVDDGSTDGSLQVLRSIEAAERRVRVFQHDLHRGQSAAHATGFQKARGGILITMDSDGQNNPADIPKLLQALTRCDGACGVRAKRRDSWPRRASSTIGNGFRNWLTGVRVTDAGCAYRALRREALAELPVFDGLHRFLPTILKLQGYRLEEVEVGHRPRRRGVSKYGVVDRAMRGVWDCLAILWYRRRVLPGRREPEPADSGGETR